MLPGVERALMRLAEVAPQFIHELKRLNDNLEKLERRRRPDDLPRERGSVEHIDVKVVLPKE